MISCNFIASTIAPVYNGVTPPASLNKLNLSPFLTFTICHTFVTIDPDAQRVIILLGTFEYNLPGGVRVNYANIQSLGKEEKAEILAQINSENTPSWFMQWN